MSPRRATSKLFYPLALCLALLTSCSTTDSSSNTSSTLRPDIPAPFDRSSVLVFDPLIAEKLTVDSQTVESIDGLYVTHTVFNPSLLSEPLHLKAQTFFKNEAGQTLDVSPIKEIVIVPRTPLVYIAHSPKSQITKFVVYLRDAMQELPPHPASAATPSYDPSAAAENSSSIPKINLQNLH